jgi:hypothetical protein
LKKSKKEVFFLNQDISITKPLIKKNKITASCPNLKKIENIFVLVTNEPNMK